MKKHETFHFSFIDYKELEQLVDYVYNVLLAQGKVSKIMDYDYICSPEDIKSEIKVCLLSRIRNFNPKKTSLKMYALICAQEAVTNFYKSGAREGMVTRNVNNTELTDEKYQVYRSRYTFLDVRSKRRKTSVEESQNMDDNDRYDFFERNLVPGAYVKSSEEILIEKEENNCYEEEKDIHLKERIKSLLENSNSRKRKIKIKKVYTKQEYITGKGEGNA